MAADRHRTDPPRQPDPWFEDAVFYMCPVRSFFDANGDGVGDFAGLTQKLDHIQQLGASCIWLLPFFPSPMRDDGYDVSDYRDIRPELGTMGDVRRFLDAAHRQGLRVAAEMVVNHTSDLHPWFQAARHAPAGSALRDFYVWSDRPGRFESARSGTDPGRHWTWDPQADAFYWHRFGESQPDLNFENPAVVDEMEKVLRFWADAGIDGLCLNGAAYLVERDDAGYEHLPETHAVLKRFRTTLVADYPDLMLQAGVSCWPEIAATYFGSGDECHMTPQLALAPRLFFALQQEDCRPLVEFLNRTPTPPSGCQWVTLLRNHDELTLSLATDEERDYLFESYAAEPTMRREGGIVRRLAPLAEFNRRKIELLYGLLFALPGAPVIYYGDELGMGDNVFLGGRGGVRTPMHWTGDRNAGFSTADPSRLTAPPVADPVGGFAAVNVQAQLQDSSSLLQWLRRMIALRRKHGSLASGDIQVLEPQSGPVFSFVRHLTLAGGESETILAISNLSRTTQAVELDLSRYAGLVPVEMSGRTPLPRIGQSPYVFTLPPFGFYWLQLQKEPRRFTRLVDAELELLDRVPLLDWKGDPDQLWTGPSAPRLTGEILPAFLRSQRWFGGKSKAIQNIELRDRGRLGAFDSGWLEAWLLSVTLGDGRRDLYSVPVAFVQGNQATELLRTARASVIARLEGSSAEAILVDALATDDYVRRILQMTRADESLPLAGGVLTAHSTSNLEQLLADVSAPLPIARPPATSSNSLVFLGRRLLLKQFRRPERGTNPDFEVTRFLTENQGFRRTPQAAGILEYRAAGDDEPYTLGLLQALVPNQGDGWSHALHELNRYYDRASARMFGPDLIRVDPRSAVELENAAPPASALETIAGYLRSAQLLGRRTAEMHRALPEATSPNFAPEPLTRSDLKSQLTEIEFQFQSAVSALNERHSRLPSDVAESAQVFLTRGREAIAALARDGERVPTAQKTRIHGDYHLGQVLVVDEDYVILDFEGEPTRTVAERREKFTPLRDVAGMLRSYHYAAYAGLFKFTQDRPGDLPRLTPWAELWQQWVCAAFLAEYRRVAAGADFLPTDPEDFRQLLNRYMLAKALYELVYELNNRPDWVAIPLGGVLQVLGLQQALSPPLTEASS